MNDKVKLLLIAALVVIAAYFAWPNPAKVGFRDHGDGTKEIFSGYGYKLGLDLQGGSELRLRLKLKELRPGVKPAEATHRAQEILERRINFSGLKEPRITTFGEDQILIQLPGVDFSEVQRVKNIITTSGKLEFKLVAQDDVQDVWRQTKTVPVGYRVYARKLTAEQLATGEGGDSVLVKDRVEMEGNDVATASDHFSVEGSSGFEVEVKMTPAGRRTFDKLTREHVGDQLAIILDDGLVSHPVIREPIPGGTAQITGNFDAKEAKDLSTVLRSGSLPAGLELVAETYVGPSLGEDSIRRGTLAGIVAMIAVLVFMVFFYHAAGVVANIALIMNVALLLGLLSVFNATLTLPGIAGIILTLGMAVDANIIIYERIREERDRGKPLVAAFESGFDRAFWTVFDSNITTLIAGIVLYYAGTGAIKGFAVTLCAGIVTTMFTALTCTQTMLRLLITGGFGPLQVSELTMVKTFKGSTFAFMRIGPSCIKGSLILIAAGLAIFALRGSDNFGIDFNGGTVLNVRFNSAVPIEEVRAGLSSVKDEKGVAKYGDAEVQSVMAVAATSGGPPPTEFAVRTGSAKQEDLKRDVLGAFAGKVPLPPIDYPQPTSLDKPGNAYHGGARMVVNLRSPLERPAFTSALAALTKKLVMSDVNVRENPSGPTSYEFVLSPGDNGRIGDLETTLRGAESGIPLSPDPFPSVQNIGPSVARELKSQAIWALIWSWLAMILYIGVRFDFKFGAAAVVALIHDVLVCIGVQAFIYMVLPRSFGISLDMGLTTVAAWLTIVGYSVNDTIVIFDRIRENMREMKKEPLDVIMNAAINQTLGRTILTSMTVFLTVLALFGFTMHSGGGVASFSFPMLVGVITGTYSSVYIASYLVLRWSGHKPAAVVAP